MKKTLFTLLLLLTTGTNIGYAQIDKVVFKTFDNKPIYLNDLAIYSKEKPVILYTWIKVCKPCVLSLDYINNAYDSLQTKNFKFYSINIDSFSKKNTDRSYFQFKTEMEFKNFVLEKNWAFETIYDPNGTYIKNILNGKAATPQFWVLYNNELIQYESSYITSPQFFDDYVSDVVKSFQTPVNRKIYYPSLNGEQQIFQIYNLTNGARTGTWESYHLSLDHKFVTNQLSFIRHYIDGQPNGKWINYFRNGKIKEEINFNNGKRDGEYSWYHDNGKLSIRGLYRLDKKNGLWKKYDKEGKIMEETNF